MYLRGHTIRDWWCVLFHQSNAKHLNTALQTMLLGGGRMCCLCHPAKNILRFPATAMMRLWGEAKQCVISLSRKGLDSIDCVMNRLRSNSQYWDEIIMSDHGQVVENPHRMHCYLILPLWRAAMLNEKYCLLHPFLYSPYPYIVPATWATYAGCAQANELDEWWVCLHDQAETHPLQRTITTCINSIYKLPWLPGRSDVLYHWVMESHQTIIWIRISMRGRVLVLLGITVTPPRVLILVISTHMLRTVLEEQPFS